MVTAVGSIQNMNLMELNAPPESTRINRQGDRDSPAACIGLDHSMHHSITTDNLDSNVSRTRYERRELQPIDVVEVESWHPTLVNQVSLRDKPEPTHPRARSRRWSKDHPRRGSLRQLGHATYSSRQQTHRPTSLHWEADVAS